MNRKVFLSFSILLIFTILFSSSSALSFTFDQVVDMISSAKIDGQQIFTDGVEFDIDRTSTINGPILLCLLSDQADVSFILPQNNNSEGYMWRSVNKKYLDFCMDFLIPTLSDYVDYKGGRTITFQISTQTIPSSDFAVLTYSPYLKNPDNRTDGSTFSDKDLFIREVKKYAKAIMAF